MIGQFVVRNFLYRPNCQEQNYHFAALNLYKVKERRLSTLRNWMLTLSFNILICVYLWRKAFKKLNHNLITEENSSQCLKILSQVTIEDENELAEREVFPKTINEWILRQWQQTYLEKLLCLLQCFFTRTNGEKMETTSRQTQCLVSKILQRYIKELRLTVLLVLTE